MTPAISANFSLQAVVFCLVAAAFSTVYITQPVLPVLSQEFGADAFQVSLTISAVILGIAISNMPFGILADRLPVHRILLFGGVMVALCSLLAAASTSLWLLTAARFVQGLFIPALTTCLAAYLARSLPAERLNVVMGSYVSATVTGGLGGRLLGGWLHPPTHWRYAFVSAAVLVLIATFVAARRLREPAPPKQTGAVGESAWRMLRRADLLRIYCVAFAAFFVFSSVFNYLPFHLSAPPLNLATEYITALYLTYVIGILIGPLAGGFSNRFGNGRTMVAGSVVFGLALMISLLPSPWAIGLALALVCAGYFAIHAAAVGALNRKMRSGRGRANALYVLFYYAGGWTGITVSGLAYADGGWNAVVGLSLLVLVVPLASGVLEHRRAPV